MTTADDDTGEFPVPVLVPRDELEALARLVLEANTAMRKSVLGIDAVRAMTSLTAAARRVLPSLPAVDSVDRE